MNVVVDSLGVSVAHFEIVAVPRVGRVAGGVTVWNLVAVHVGDNVCLVVRRRSHVLSHVRSVAYRLGSAPVSADFLVTWTFECADVLSRPFHPKRHSQWRGKVRSRGSPFERGKRYTAL